MAFHTLCADLGAMRCSVVSAEEDGTDVTARVKAAGIPTPGGPLSPGVSFSSSTRSGASASVLAEYPRPTRGLRRSESGWMLGEPSWAVMQQLRLERGLEQFRAELSYFDEQGIDAEVSAKLSGIGLKLGGSFQKLTRRKWQFEVQFWPLAECLTEVG